jgi:cell division transport system permease protein
MAPSTAPAPTLLRPRDADELGLRRALGDRMLPLLVAAMAFLAILALAGALAAAQLAGRWQGGAGSTITVQVPRADAPAPPAADGPSQTRLDRVLAALKIDSSVADVRQLGQAELADMLRPWLGTAGETLSVPLPAVLAVRLVHPEQDVSALAERLDAASPGTLTESSGLWVRRLAALARSLQACAWLALLMVSLVAGAVVMVATRAGLAARRESIEIIHGLGATDGYIAGRFARRATTLAAIGGLTGAVASLPVLLVLAVLAAPFTEASGPARPGLDMASPMALLHALPLALWVALPCLPLASALLGFITTQATVRQWLRQLP